MTVNGESAVARLRRRAAKYEDMAAAIKRHALELRDIYAAVVNLIVYVQHPPGAPDGPKKYQRTYNLLNSITIKTVTAPDGKVGLRIFFDQAVSAAKTRPVSYSIYVPLSEGFLTTTRHWTSEWRVIAYDAIIEKVTEIIKAELLA